MSAVHVQVASDDPDVPEPGQIAAWARAAIAGRRDEAELTVRVVDNREGEVLNARYRGGKDATNVLSFPFEAPPGVDLGLLGDIVVCAPVLAREAREQGKDPLAHWAHVVVHGALHLLGLDHQNAEEAEHMECLEREILARIGFPDPYREDMSA